MDYILRKATPADRAQIEELFLEMLRAIYRKEPAEGYEAGYLDKFFSGGKDRICVAEQGGRVIAYLSVEVHGDFIYLDDLSVTEAYRNKGIGSRLIRKAEGYAKELGIAKIVFHVDEGNTAAYRLYLRLGYRPAAREGSRIRMEKPL